jgi:hypothetical protein
MLGFPLTPSGLLTSRIRTPSHMATFPRCNVGLFSSLPTTDFRWTTQDVCIRASFPRIGAS